MKSNMTEFFDTMVFDAYQRNTTLPKEVHKKSKTTIEDKKSLNEDWAFVNDITHWFQQMTVTTAKKHIFFSATDGDDELASVASQLSPFP